VDRRIFDVEAAGLEPADQPLAMAARLGEAKLGGEGRRRSPIRWPRAERERLAERVHRGAEIVLGEIERGVEQCAAGHLRQVTFITAVPLIEAASALMHQGEEAAPLLIR
jgi:hypothetical protein